MLTLLTIIIVSFTIGAFAAFFVSGKLTRRILHANGMKLNAENKIVPIEPEEP